MEVSILSICSWINMAGNGVKSEVNIRAFMKCGISNAGDGAEDNAIFDQSDSSNFSDDNDELLKI